MANEHSSGYLTGKEDVITSFAGIYPKSNPQIIIYASAARPTEASQKPLSNSVKEIVLSGFQGRCGLRPFYTKAEKRVAMENIRKMGIEDLKNRCYRELSGGQQQRVLLARALCATKKMLLLDEPVAGLDPIVTADMYSLIESLNKNEGITIIMISHDISAALKYATHILHISDELFFGTRRQFEESKAGKRLSVLMGGEF